MVRHRLYLSELSSRLILFSLILVVLFMTCSAGSAATLSRMRPYTGIGLIVLSRSDNALSQDLQLPLYEEPGLLRVGILDNSGMTGNEWIFGLTDATPLIVSARKDDWLRIFYDDAGREAWIRPQNKWRFQSWEQFLKLQIAHMLPGLQPQHYQLLQQPGSKMFTTLTPKRVLKVLKLENSWCMVLTDQSQIGWVRWRDDDGRLLVGLYH